MYPQHELHAIYTQIVGVVTSTPSELYSNWSLGGPINVPMFPKIFVPFWLEPGEGKPRYVSLAVDQGAILPREALREKILRLSVPQRVIDMQKEQVETVNQFSTIHDFIVSAVNARYRDPDLPIGILMFSRTRDTDEEAVHIYQSPNLPTVLLLDEIKSAIRDNVEGEGG